MSGALPSRINPFRLANQGAIVKGAVPLAHMHRLGKAILSRQGAAKVSLHFISYGNVYVLAGSVCALLKMQCQRCLQPVVVTIDRPFELAMARSEAEAVRLQTEYEVLEVEDEIVFTRDLVEDELLLSLPLISKHNDPVTCNPAMLDSFNRRSTEIENDAQSLARNPLAVLKALIKR